MEGTCTSPDGGVTESFCSPLLSGPCLVKGQMESQSPLGNPFRATCEWWSMRTLASSESQLVDVLRLKLHIACKFIHLLVHADAVTNLLSGFASSMATTLFQDSPPKWVIETYGQAVTAEERGALIPRYAQHPSLELKCDFWGSSPVVAVVNPAAAPVIEEVTAPEVRS